MGKTAEFFKAMQAHLNDVMGADVDHVVISQLNPIEVIDAGQLSPGDGSRATVAIVLRHSDEPAGAQSAGGALQTQPLMQALLLSAVKRDTIEADTLRLFDLKEQLQAAVQPGSFTPNNNTQAYTTEYRGTLPAVDLNSQFFGFIVNVAGLIMKV